MIQELIKRYIWLIDTIARARDEGITYQQINEKWQHSSLSNGEPYPWRTYQNHKKNVEEIFGIVIKCRKTNDTYYIADNDELQNTKGFQKWMLETISLGNNLYQCDKLRNRILLEDVPSGRIYLQDVLQAMQESHKIMFYYRPYWWEGEAPQDICDFEPYALKMFKRRWYLLGRKNGLGEENTEDNDLRIYALDRFEDIDIAEDKFSMPDSFDAESFFQHYFGIIVDSHAKIETVKLKVDVFQAKYFRSLPLHSSQEEIESNDNYAVFAYRLKPTFDFRQELLSLGDCVEVLSPSHFRKEMQDTIKQMRALYQTKK